MRGRWRRSRYVGGLALLAALLPALTLFRTPAAGQFGFNEREVKAQVSDLEKGEVFTLDFRFKDPRLIKVNVPGRGTRICWYMWYQVINRTKNPETLIPEFELVAHDIQTVYYDEVLPAVEDAIKRLEDPSGYQDIKNSVTISLKPIPSSPPGEDRFPQAVTGVAIWDGTPADGNKRAAGKKDLSDANRYSIFVSGLSNGFVRVDPSAQEKEPPPIRRKTLQLNFKRLGDRYFMDSREISFEPPGEWIYRASRLRVPELPGEPPAKKDEPPPPAPKVGVGG